MDYLQKPVTYSKSLVHLSKNKKYLCQGTLSVPSERTVLVSLFTNKINYGNSFDDSYCIEMQKAALLMYAIYPFPNKVQIYTLLYVGY